MNQISWRGAATDIEIETLHGRAFDHGGTDGVAWNARMERYSLGWVTARDQDDALVGFCNVVTDGGEHAWLQDVVVDPSQQRTGIGRDMILLANAQAAAAGTTWMHVDFAPEHREFYLDACGFEPTDAGLRRLD